MTAEQERLRISFAPDRETVTIEFLPASGATGMITVDADQLLKFVRTLGSVRSTMVEGQPIPPLKGQSVDAVFSTEWYIEPGLMGEASQIAFQHPGFGPLGFLVPIDQVPAMLQILSDQVDEHRASKERRPN